MWASAPVPSLRREATSREGEEPWETHPLSMRGSRWSGPSFRRGIIKRIFALLFRLPIPSGWQTNMMGCTAGHPHRRHRDHVTSRYAAP